MMYAKASDRKVLLPYERCVLPTAPHGCETVDVYRLKRDDHGNSIYTKVDEENIQQYINSFETGCSLKAILDRIQLMPVHDKVRYLQQSEEGQSADLTAMPTDGTEAQIMLMKLKREHPEIVERMNAGETFEKVITDLFGKKEEAPSVYENKVESEVVENG